MNDYDVPPLESYRIFIGMCAILDGICIGKGDCENCEVTKNEKDHE
jgi:hypothetical protein